MDQGSKLWETFWDLAVEENPTLEAFLERVAAGEFGPYTPQEITAFLREVEATMIGNIQTKVLESPTLGGAQEDAVAETRRRIQRLIEQYGDPRVG